MGHYIGIPTSHVPVFKLVWVFALFRSSDWRSQLQSSRPGLLEWVYTMQHRRRRHGVRMRQVQSFCFYPLYYYR